MRREEEKEKEREKREEEKERKRGNENVPRQLVQKKCAFAVRQRTIIERLDS